MQNDLSNLSDERLVAQIKKIVADELLSLAELLTLLAEMDERKLYAKLGYPSLFSFIIQELRLSEDAAYKRIQAARVAKRFPVILGLISEGKINLTSVMVLSPILTEGNHDELLTKAAYKTRTEVERIRATYDPKPDVPDMMRKLSTTTRSGASSENETQAEDVHVDEQPEKTHCEVITTPARRDAMQPLSEQRVKFQFTGSEVLRGKVERAKQLLRHKHPNGRLEDIVEEALDALLEKKDPEKRIERKLRCHSELKAKNPDVKSRSLPDRQAGFVALVLSNVEGLRMTDQGHSRYIPQHVKDAVWKRDHGKCRYVGKDGRRCDEKGGLEFDHVRPWAKGVSSNDPENIRLLCHAHNQLAMRSEFGGHKRYP